jgi:hypothetical protein
MFKQPCIIYGQALQVKSLHYYLKNTTTEHSSFGMSAEENDLANSIARNVLEDHKSLQPDQI